MMRGIPNAAGRSGPTKPVIAAIRPTRIEVEDVFDAGEAVVSVLTIRGTHGGPMGDIPLTGKPFTLRGVQILSISCRSWSSSGSWRRRRADDA